MGYKYRLHYIKHKMLSMYKLPPPPIYKAPLYIKSIKKAYSIYIQRFIYGQYKCMVVELFFQIPLHLNEQWIWKDETNTLELIRYLY
jgi:hypothetical protein